VLATESVNVDENPELPTDWFSIGKPGAVTPAGSPLMEMSALTFPVVFDPRVTV
jgi:hypothetical protein